jgi:hypothetical protein
MRRPHGVSYQVSDMCFRQSSQHTACWLDKNPQPLIPHRHTGIPTTPSPERRATQQSSHACRHNVDTPNMPSTTQPTCRSTHASHTPPVPLIRFDVHDTQPTVCLASHLPCPTYLDSPRNATQRNATHRNASQRSSDASGALRLRLRFPQLQPNAPVRLARRQGRMSVAHNTWRTAGSSGARWVARLVG